MIIEIYSPEILASARKLVCLDRDNTLIRDSGYMDQNAEIEFNTALLTQLLSFDQHETSFCLVSNQSGIGRGLISVADVIHLNRRLSKDLLKRGIRLSASIFCPHSPSENCPCRKPKPTMLNIAMRLHESIDASSQIMYGDKHTDEEAALSANFIWRRAPVL